MVKKREQKKAEKVKAKNKEILKECDIETTPLRLNFLRFVVEERKNACVAFGEKKVSSDDSNIVKVYRALV